MLNIYILLIFHAESVILTYQFQINFREFVENGEAFSGELPLTLDGEDRGSLDVEMHYQPFDRDSRVEQTPSVIIALESESISLLRPFLYSLGK